MSPSQKERVEEFLQFYKWPADIVLPMVDVSRSFFEMAWLALNPKTAEERFKYYDTPWLTFRQMTYEYDQALPDYVREFIDQMRPGQRLVSVGCGVGDDLLYAAERGIEVFAVEVPHKLEFLKFRFERRGFAGFHLDTELQHTVYDRALLLSSLDHLDDPVLFCQKLVTQVNSKILAQPRETDSFKRPTHEKFIIDQLPAAFAILDKHNAAV